MSWNQIIQSLLFDVLHIPVGTWRYICKFKNPLQSLVWIYLHIPMWPILFYHTACGRSSWTFCEWIGFRKWSGKLDLIQINLFLNYFLLYPSNSRNFRIWIVFHTILFALLLRNAKKTRDQFYNTPRDGQGGTTTYLTRAVVNKLLKGNACVSSNCYVS